MCVWMEVEVTTLFDGGKVQRAQKLKANFQTFRSYADCLVALGAPLLLLYSSWSSLASDSARGGDDEFLDTPANEEGCGSSESTKDKDL